VKNSSRGSFLFVVVLLVAFSCTGFAAACTTWSLGNGVTTIAPGTSATGSAGDPCTLGTDTFSNFTVFNGATSNTDIVVAASFAAPATLTFSVTNLNAMTDFDAIYEVMPYQSTITVSEVAALGNIDFTVCSKEVMAGQSCAGEGGTVLGSGMVTGSETVTSPLLVSTTGADWVFEDVSGTTSFSNSFTTPEPVTFSLMGLGLLAIGFAGRKRMRKD
jgi:hypothetical protein